MSLVEAGTFGSLPEASIVFSSLASAGFNPVAGYNMNTPGVAGGMAPSAYRVLVPAGEAQAARQFLSELRQAFADDPGDLEAAESPNEVSDEAPGRTTLGKLRVVARVLVAAGLAACVVMTGVALLGG